MIREIVAIGNELFTIECLKGNRQPLSLLIGLAKKVMARPKSPNETGDLAV
jgi:hypothetical protein